MIKLLLKKKKKKFTSHLFDEKSFYDNFIKDLLRCKKEVIIESPFISNSRMKSLFPVFEKLIKRNIKIYVMTKHPSILREPLASQSAEVIRWFETLGVQVLSATNHHHRKLAIIDRKILWEGSLNILSQSNSREIMRRIDGEHYAKEMFDFL